jgi:hypothetical protein
MVRKFSGGLPKDRNQNSETHDRERHVEQKFDAKLIVEKRHACFHGMISGPVPFYDSSKLLSRASINSSIVYLVELSIAPVRMTLP